METPVITRPDVAAALAVRPTYLDSAFLVMERVLLLDYCGDDLNAACEAAKASNDATLQACAALDPRKRSDAFRAWRKKVIEKMLSRVPLFHPYLQSLCPEHADDIRCGEVDLGDIDAGLNAFEQALKTGEQAAKHQAKMALLEAQKDLLHDAEDCGNEFYFPHFLVILANGEIGLFSKRSNANAWAKQSGLSYFLVKTDDSSMRRQIVSTDG